MFLGVFVLSSVLDNLSKITEEITDCPLICFGKSTSYQVQGVSGTSTLTPWIVVVDKCSWTAVLLAVDDIIGIANDHHSRMVCGGGHLPGFLPCLNSSHFLLSAIFELFTLLYQALTMSAFLDENPLRHRKRMKT